MAEHRLPLSTIVVDPAVRERELFAVVSLLAHPFTQSDMDKWVSVGRERYNVFRDAFWGNPLAQIFRPLGGRITRRRICVHTPRSFCRLRVWAQRQLRRNGMSVKL